MSSPVQSISGYLSHVPWFKSGPRKLTSLLQSSFTLYTTSILGSLFLFRLLAIKNISFKHITARLKLALYIPVLSLAGIYKAALELRNTQYLRRSDVPATLPGIDESAFPGVDEFDRVLIRIEEAGARTTGSKAHDEFISWIEHELCKLPNVTVRSDSFSILRWQPAAGRSLKDAGKLSVNTSTGESIVPIAGVVPFSLSTKGQSGEMIYLPGNVDILQAQVKGKVILKDFPAHAIPYVLGLIPSYSKTADLNGDILSNYDRPGFADEPLHQHLMAAGRAGAAGLIVMFDIASQEVESYFEPHKGTHYQLPAVFVGVDEAVMLKAEAAKGSSASLSVEAEVATVETRNVTATLPGQISERVIYLSHTDGNTLVQENGPVSLLALAQYFSKQPLSARKRTLEFTFNSGHLHISREGSLRHAQQLNDAYDQGDLALVIPIEHLGTREIEPVARSHGRPGRELHFSGRNEIMFWCVGPSPAVVRAVQQALKRRKLDRVLVTRGVSVPNLKQVPTFTSFGGIGTYYHNLLMPTTSLISGPWSLWAPNFGREAVDVERLRSQTLALGDVYASIEDIPRSVIAGGYTEYRERSRRDGMGVTIEGPPEQACLADKPSSSNGAVKY